MFLLARELISTTLRSSVRYHSINVAIVGSGPAGFYTTQKLLRNDKIKVDIYEKLPVPFGLVRYGVAPDHADVKNVINSFTATANNDRVNFYGNVGLGDDIKLDELIDAYHAVVLCYGSAKDKLLNIEGENDAKNLISARNFVGWYNGVPEDKDLKVNVDCDTACIIGQGNVALDCARIILNPSKFKSTDITTHAQKQLAESKIRRIYIVGRRGPIQVSFSSKELREILSLNENRVRIEPYDVFRRNDVTLERLQTLSRQRRRLTEQMISISPKMANEFEKSTGVELVFKFFAKPHRITDDSLEVRRTEFSSVDKFMDDKAQPSDQDEIEVIKCGLMIRSIGYQAVMVDSNLPYNHKLGAILNSEGKVQGYTSLYCSGWLATGASGVIAGTLSSSHTTARSILSDVEQKRIPNTDRIKPGYEAINTILRNKSKQVIHFNDWLRIDELEKRLGQAIDKPREKLVDVKTMLETARK